MVRMYAQAHTIDAANVDESICVSMLLLDHRKGREIEEGWQLMELARMLICPAATTNFLRVVSITNRFGTGMRSLYWGLHRIRRVRVVTRERELSECVFSQESRGKLILS